MDKLREFGRKAMFYVRVLSGYEERRIRNFRLQIEKQLQQAEARKAAIRKIPEQIILSEVRQMVEQMQSVNKQLEETEAAIDKYFKAMDKEAQMIMNVQLEGEEKSKKEMFATMQQRALLETAKAERAANTHQPDTKQSNPDATSSTTQHGQMG